MNTLKEIVKEIATEMQGVNGVAAISRDDLFNKIREWSSSLLVAVKMTPDDFPARKQWLGGGLSGLPPEPAFSPGAQHASEVEKIKRSNEFAHVREEARKQGLIKQDGEGFLQRLCVDGPLENTSVDCNVQMPVGARDLFAGCVYKLGDDGQLYFQEKENAEVAEKLQGTEIKSIIVE